MNPDVIECIESNPDTLLSLTGGRKLYVMERHEDVVSRYNGNMILLTRLNKERTTFLLNADLIETMESTPDTLITLTTAKKFHVRETLPTIVEMGRGNLLLLTRLDKERREFSVNADVIEFLEAAPDTCISFISGRRCVVQETIDEIVDKVVEYNSRVIPVVIGGEGESE